MRQTRQDRIIAILNGYSAEKDEIQQRYGSGRIEFDEMASDITALQEKYVVLIEKIALK